MIKAETVTSIFRIVFAVILLVMTDAVGIFFNDSMLENGRTIFRRIYLSKISKRILMIFTSDKKITSFLIAYQILMVYPTLIMVCIAIITEIGVINLLPKYLQNIFQIVNANRPLAGTFGILFLPLYLFDQVMVRIFKKGH